MFTGYARPAGYSKAGRRIHEAGLRAQELMELRSRRDRPTAEPPDGRKAPKMGQHTGAPLPAVLGPSQSKYVGIRVWRRYCWDLMLEVAKSHSVTLYELRSPRDVRRIPSAARHEAMWKCAKLAPLSNAALAVVFGCCHSSVAEGIRKHCERAGVKHPRR